MDKRNQYKIAIMAVLLAVACYLTYYCHTSLHIGHVFTHLFYIPIFLASFWWKRKGLTVAVFLGGLLILSHILLRADATSVNDYLRAGMFLLVGFLIAMVSERIAKADEALLEKSKQEKEIILSNMSELVVYYNKDMRISWANKAAGEMFGLPPEQLVGHTCYEILGHYNEPCESCPIAKTLKTGEPQEGEITTPNGKVWFVRGYPVRNAQGEIENVFEVAMDITDRKAVDEQLQKRQAELFHVSRLTTIGEMASGLAHELNQPLCAAINYTNACLHHIRRGNADTDKLIESMKASVQQTERAGEIINSIKNFVKKHESHKSTVDINKLIKKLPDFIAADICHNKVSFNLSLTEQVPMVLADHVQIEQVLLNLILNGIEAMADIEAGKRQLTIQTSSTDQGVEIAVSDTGNGMPDEICEKIFNSFFTTKPDGMGIGLSISKTIVEAHKGRIWVDRSVDCGTTFRFTLPAAETKS